MAFRCQFPGRSAWLRTTAEPASPPGQAAPRASSSHPSRVERSAARSPWLVQRDTPATVSLSGIGGLTGAVQITPSMLNFPLTGVGATSSPITVTIANSSAAVELDNLRLSASSGFKTGNSTCGEELKAGSSCTVDVSFAPAAVGAQNGTLTLTSEQLAASVTVPLSGMGFDFQATTSGASSQTVSSGQTATFSSAWPTPAHPPPRSP